MDHDDSEGPGPPNPVPFVVALVGFVIVAVLAFVYLREEPAELLRPERITAVDRDTVRAVAPDRPACERVVRAQVDMAEEAVFLEFVVEEVPDDGAACTGAVVPFVAEVTLPDAIDDRPLRPGVGRFQIPCAGQGSEITCTPDR